MLRRTLLIALCILALLCFVDAQWGWGRRGYGGGWGRSRFGGYGWGRPRYGGWGHRGFGRGFFG
ncbi:hypothetical protein OESDEN_02042 [Oesophagostomum dentatum]|uniref:Uncharacterized protein n=1 Tax=Oesophagostomum dentatum TaxID=61180 RepID=A0A0B1TL35_OESDE|nr:hypothetical protein OESDEN_02042 [Oesophagostomum dentatum]